jgi:hypothetical protein
MFAVESLITAPPSWLTLLSTDELENTCTE